MNELALFAGAGGELLASKWLLGWRTVCYVEWEAYAVEVLKARIRDGWLDDAPIWDDAFTFDGRPWRGCVDIVTAGFPCQPFSIAGKGLAEADPRNGWPAVIRILREVRPRFALLENVPGLLAKPYARVIFGELAEAGFDAEWDCITAEEVGANHRRERLWMLAYAAGGAEYVAEQPREEGAYAEGDGVAQQMADARGDGMGKRGFEKDVRSSDGHGQDQRGRKSKDQDREQMADADDAASARQREDGREIHAVAEAERFNVGGGTLSDAYGAGLSKPEQEREFQGSIAECSWWTIEPRLGRVADGVADRVERLRAIGNGQVPRVAEEAWKRLVSRKRSASQ